jgi:Uma2 family endonuclease
MSTIEQAQPKTSLPPLVPCERLDQPTFHERYEAMPPETRAELVGGIVYMPSPMSGDHGDWTWAVFGWLNRYAELTPGLKGNIGSTVKLSLESEPQPDLHIRILGELGGRIGIDSEGYLTGAPELVVEIARSSRAYDLNDKKDDYERAGVTEYIVVEIDPNRIHWFVRNGDHFEEMSPGPDGIYRSKVFPGLWLDPAALFAGNIARRNEVLDQGMRTSEYAAFVARLSAGRLGASQTN